MLTGFQTATPPAPRDITFQSDQRIWMGIRKVLADIVRGSQKESLKIGSFGR